MKWINRYTGFLRTIRALYWLNNLQNRKYLQRTKKLYQSFGIKRSVLKSIDSRTLKRYVGDIRNFKASQIENINSESSPLREQWENEGFVILKGFLNEHEVATINNDIEDGLRSEQLHYNYTGRKIFNAHNKVDSIKKVAESSKLHSTLKQLLGDTAIHFQTINFKKGSEQQAHSDSIHMTTLPLGQLAGVWVALEAVDCHNGPLVYYPGSHKMTYILNDDYGNSSNGFLLDGNANAKYENHVAEVLKNSSLEAKELHTDPGDVLIWHANLIHGGMAIKDEQRTRKSMVMHYFTEHALCFHEISERLAIIK